MKAEETTKGRGDNSRRRSSEIEIEVIRSGKDKKRFDQLLKEKHYLGKAKPVGDFLRQVAVRDGQWVGLLAWGPACYSLRDRDEWTGWSPTLRAERQKLVVQNRRFLLLVKRGAEPNLASQVLGASVRELPGQWEESFGYQPVLAETFVDIEQYEGTCYRAAGWEPVGMSKGLPLGKVTKRQAENVKLHVEHLVACKRTGTVIPPATQAWLEELPDSTRKRLEDLDLVVRRVRLDDFTVVTWTADYMAKRTDIKPNARRNMEQARTFLLEFTPSDLLAMAGWVP